MKLPQTHHLTPTAYPANAYDQQAEEAVLGSVLMFPGTVLIVAKYIRSNEAFYYPRHQLIWNAILLLSADSEQIDLLTVTHKLREMGKLEQAGGVVYLAEITSSYQGYSTHLENWCMIILEHFARRQLSTAGLQMVKDSSDITIDITEGLSRGKERIEAISQNLTIAGEETLLDTCKEVIKELDLAISSPEDVYISWHIPELDRGLGGIRSPSADFWIVAGAPGCGKTALFVHTAVENALNNVPVGMVSLEMPRKDLIRRMAVSRMKGQYTNDEVRKGFDANGEAVDILVFQQALSTFANAPLYICDEGGLDIYRLTLIALDWKQRYGIRILLIDYLQLLQDSTVTSNTDTARISSVSRKLKALAKLLDIPIIAISNLSKAAAHTGDKRPHKEHLRESGQIEFDADGIMLLFRPKYHMIDRIEEGSGYPPVEDTRYLIQAQVEKNRNGPCTIVNMWADVATNRFFQEQPRSVDYTPF